MRILAVEDDALILMSTAETLEDLGHFVLRATNGRDALTLLASEDVEVLLTDVGLRGMSGIELALEAVRQRPQLAVIFATGQTVIDAQQELARAVLLRKPFTDASLAAAIQASRRSK